MMVGMVASRLVPAALTSELGAPGGYAVQQGGTNQWETTPELTWPLNLRVFDKMRTSDPQQQAILRAAKLPLIRTKWRVSETPDVDPRVREFVELELGLRADNQGRYRSRPGGVSWIEFLRHALLMLDYGHMPFEQVYALGRSDVAGINFQVAHLSKLGPRMPRTLAGFDVAGDGGLNGIFQYVTRNQTEIQVFLPIETLAVFVNEREGADWMGHSLLRASYKHWMIKDAMLRIAALAGERNGLGLPVVTYPKQSASSNDKNTALRMAAAIRAGDEAGVALEEGWTLELLGVTGAVMDLLPWVNYHDQAAAKGTLEMFLDLGHDAGARALGDTFVDYFMMAEQALVEQLQETVTEHVVRDLVRLNFGPDEPYPSVVADDLVADSTTTALALQQLESAGLLTPDDPLEADLRRRYNLPVADPVSAAARRAIAAPPQLAPDGSPVDGSPEAPAVAPAGTTPPARPGTPAGAGAPAVRGPGGPAGSARAVVKPSVAPGSARPLLIASAGVDSDLLSRARAAMATIEALAAAHGDTDA